MGRRGPQRNFANYTKIGNSYYNTGHFFKSQEPAENGCIHWTGGSHRQGYGMCGGIDAESGYRFMTVTHRAAMIIHLNRELEPGENVIHKVGCKPCCVNPEHLQIGDLRLRNAVMRANGNGLVRRPRGPSGHTHGRQTTRTYKYSDEDIIFSRVATMPEIMARFGIDRATAARLRHGMRIGYKWLKSPGQKITNDK